MRIREAFHRLRRSFRAPPERRSQLPAPEEVALSRHCVDQFKTRFRPALERAVARAELERLLPHAEVAEEMPDWLAATAKSQGDAYLLIGPDMVLPVARNREEPRWVAKTCLARGSISRARRQERNEAGRRRRARKQAQLR